MEAVVLASAYWRRKDVFVASVEPLGTKRNDEARLQVIPWLDRPLPGARVVVCEDGAVVRATTRSADW